jgi:hypothetical protein
MNKIRKNVQKSNDQYYKLIMKNFKLNNYHYSKNDQR